MIPAPCKKNGVDCKTRHIGCQSKCQEYLAFRAELDRINEEKHRYRCAAGFAAESIWHDRRKLKHTIDGRRALAQR